ncbi:hypothetical protein I4U23_028914 [Adineta vaga]|nr:hypothetical protein I4U23_028914 [Adineta vaga]
MFYYCLFFLFISLIKSCPLKTVDSRSGCYCGIEIDGTNYIQCQPYSIEHIPEFTRSYIHDKLNLSYNFIRNLTNQSFNQLKVKKIYLQQNLIEFIDKQTFRDNQTSYDVSFNPICTLEKNEMIFTDSFHESTQLHCDCRLAYFLNENLVDKSKLIGTNQFFRNETKCFTPISYQGVLLQTLTYEQLLSTCSNQLPNHCKEVNHFQQIQQYTKDILGITTMIPLKRNITQKIQTSTISSELSSFRLSSFYTTYEDDNLIIHWDFDTKLSTKALTSMKFQIVLEQQSSSKTHIIHRTNYLSLHLKRYTIHHIPANKSYYICLLLTRSSFGTDKYCREIRTVLSMTTTTILNPILSKQPFIHMLFTNRSIVFGFLFGTILTTGLLLTLAFICHLRSKRQHYRRATSSMFPHSHQKQQPYLCIERNNDDDGTYSNSIFSSTSSKSNHCRKTCRRTCFPPIPSDQSWYRRSLKQLPLAPPLPPPCCFHHHHHTPDTSLSSCITTRRITTLSSQYSNAMDKEAMTSTSIMSSASSDEPTISSPTKHVYEELADETTTLRRNNATDIFL